MADELEKLYSVEPGSFTALRTRLAEAAKRRGDPAMAKRISAARKPTVAAWIINRLALGDADVTQRLTDLGERLRAAHAAMDGQRIRELSAQQRTLVDELARAGFRAAEVTDPSAGLREDVTDTLQAAIADPDVAARLGRLAKAEQWSGFGQFGDTAAVSGARAASRSAPKRRAESAPEQVADGRRRDDDQQRRKARAALADAENARAAAEQALEDRQAELSAARARCAHADRSLQEARRRLGEAEHAYDRAKQVSSRAAQLVKEAKAQLR
jgi:hypothetical protein